MISLPGYHITELLHSGGKTLVYRGYREQDRCPVVFKTLASASPGAKDLARLHYEYNLTRDWNNQEDCGLIRALALVPQQNTLVLILHDIGGMALNQLMATSPTAALPLARFLPLALCFARSLGRIHQRRIIHKDINPANLVLNPDTGEAQIIDFGISSQLSRETTALQSPGHLEGTLAYLSPEQTGRMNRALDYRTDFYSLGASFYEMLTGVPPFSVTDAAELVHCHLAHMPIPPHERQPTVPAILSNLILKLMAKAPEQRYQSAFGLIADLESCWEQFKAAPPGAAPTIAPFALGRQDTSGRFQVPQKLYGREAEVQKVLEAFERASQGQTEMLLVGGYSGIGKSALVHEVYKPITEKQGYFIDGKFDQFQRDMPYASLIQAFQELMRQLLTESPARIAHWNTLMIDALGANAQVIIEVIPEVALILGPRAALPTLPPAETRNRFQASFRQFIDVFARCEHPLVLFLDDLQWADSASLSFLEELLQKSRRQYLLILGAWRDHEVNATHPLMLTLEALHRTGANFSTLKLQALAFADLERLVRDTLTPTRGEPAPLAELIAAKTGGNPFFVNAFLNSLYEGGCLKFVANEGGWQWDMQTIQARQITDNVVELMSQKLRTLPESTQALLTCAACIGHQFDLATLALVAGQMPGDVMLDLWDALKAGLLLQQDAFRVEEVLLESCANAAANLATNLATNAAINTPANAKITCRRFRFIHDRVQQAAYELLPAAATAALHLKIGRLWRKQLDLTHSDESLFAMVNQFHAATGLLDVIEDPAERIALAKLNLQAARKAIASTAFASALRYLTHGLDLLAGGDWQQQYQLTLALSLERAQCEYINHHHEAAERNFKDCLTHVKTALEKADIHLKQLELYGSQGNYQRAVEEGLAGLHYLGIKLPGQPKKHHFLLEIWEERWHRRGRNVKSLLDQLPRTERPEHQLAIRLFSGIILFAYLVNQRLSTIAILKSVNFVFRHGLTPDAAYLLMNFAAILVSMKRYSLARDYTRKAQELSQSQSPNSRSMTLFINAYSINHWYQPLHQSLACFDQCMKLALDCGNWIYASMSATNQLPVLYGIGMELSALKTRLQKFQEFIEQMNDPLKVLPSYTFYAVWITTLADANSVENAAAENAAAEQASHKLAAAAQQVTDNVNNATVSCVMYLTASFYEILFGDFPKAAVYQKKAARHLHGIMGVHTSTDYFFHNILAALATQSAASFLKQGKRWQQSLQKDFHKLRAWAKQCPQNFGHKYLLATAELARVKGQPEQAAELYDQAIAAAQQNGFIHHQALSNEWAARFYLQRSKTRLARLYLEEAAWLYGKWGAHAKVKHLATQYPGLLSQATPGLPFTTAPALPTHTTTSATNTQLLKLEALDLSSVMKASQAISGEIVLERLLEKLMRIAIESAGAQRGLLLLEKNGEWRIEAQGNVNQEHINLLQSRPLKATDSGSMALPLSLIQYAALTKESVVLANAAEQGRFTGDGYISQQRPKSVLCSPILTQGKLAGILYLENNLIEGAFTQDRLVILEMLSSQAAISIENARLYENMEATVAQRTAEALAAHQEAVSAKNELALARELEQAREQMLQQEKMAALGTLTAGVAHEINNPTHFTHMAGQILRTDLAQFEQFLHDLMAEQPDPEITAEFARRFVALQNHVGTLLDGTERIQTIVKDLRAFSRREHEQKRAVHLSECLNSTLNLVRTNWHHQVQFICEFGDDPLVECWPTLLNQVFMNLIVNACHAIASKREHSGSNEPGHIWLRLRRPECDQASAAPASLLVDIEDDGCGMEAAVRERILEPFFTTKDVDTGTGLGLSIANGIIQKHQGTLAITSTPGQGSCFTIHLPYEIHTS